MLPITVHTGDLGDVGVGDLDCMLRPPADPGGLELGGADKAECLCLTRCTHLSI